MNLVDVWKKKMREAEHQLATLQTTEAIYDIVAVISDLPNHLVIQFPKTHQKGECSITQEMVEKKDIIELRYYSW